MQEHKVELALNLNLNGEFNLHHHHHHSPNQSQPGAADILNAIRESKGTIMTQLADALASLKADDAQLEAEVEELLGKLAQVPGEIAAAVQQGLVNAGLDDTSIRQAVIEIDEGVKASIARVTASLHPVGSDTSTGSDTTSDTVAGGEGNDTLASGSGSDSVDLGSGADTLSGGQSGDSAFTGDGSFTSSVAGGQGEDTIAGGQSLNGAPDEVEGDGGPNPSSVEES